MKIKDELCHIKLSVIPFGWKGFSKFLENDFDGNELDLGRNKLLDLNVEVIKALGKFNDDESNDNNS